MCRPVYLIEPIQHYRESSFLTNPPTNFPAYNCIDKDLMERTRDGVILSSSFGRQHVIRAWAQLVGQFDTAKRDAAASRLLDDLYFGLMDYGENGLFEAKAIADGGIYGPDNQEDLAQLIRIALFHAWRRYRASLWGKS